MPSKAAKTLASIFFSTSNFMVGRTPVTRWRLSLIALDCKRTGAERQAVLAAVQLAEFESLRDLAY
jgi:hypothetical protein